MELWIRSQDKTKLEQVFSLCTFEISDGKETKYVIENSDSYLGEYKTKERALEILNEIMLRIHQLNIFELGIIRVCDGFTTIYEMPMG